ncbi:MULTISPECIES: YdaS family helix-turn-helix protein [Paraburkholderia]|uniref:YdaS family helix-turn-helix protein n=1 Tax=Paraburkholderia TaxID=1822464 RepID=UPI000382C4F9|nr:MULTISPECIES: YdaS family helix-turn-helix protein [Paraburkholderia]MDH6149317.1 DNA-binding transcriptional regulator YdaS (Cro superfamily) [Paraburkholderia sp. WSM4179]
MYITSNYIKIAVDRIGGPTKVAHACSVSNAAVHAWITSGRIPNIDRAKIVAKESGIDVHLLRGTR